MALFVDPSTVIHGIQLAVAPVFLLTAVSSMIGAVAGRLARIIDRARVLEDRIKASADAAFIRESHDELGHLRTRGILANSTIGLLTLCAFMIGLTIVVLFLGETTALRVDRFAIYAFLFGISSFMAALGCFFAETLLATRVLKFRRPLD